MKNTGSNEPYLCALSLSFQLLRLELLHSQIAQKSMYGCCGKNEMVMMTMASPLRMIYTLETARSFCLTQTSLKMAVVAVDDGALSSRAEIAGGGMTSRKAKTPRAPPLPPLLPPLPLQPPPGCQLAACLGAPQRRPTRGRWRKRRPLRSWQRRS